MSEDRQAALDRLARLRDTGAISPEDYGRLTRAINVPAGTRQGPSRAAGFLQNAGSIAAGVAVGSLAADMIANALSSDDPQGWEYTSTSETTWTEDGYTTEFTESVEPMDAGDGADAEGMDFGGFEV